MNQFITLYIGGVIQMHLYHENTSIMLQYFIELYKYLFTKNLGYTNKCQHKLLCYFDKRQSVSGCMQRIAK